MRETFVVGDVHGCLPELTELLDKAKYDPSRIRLIFVGDLVDRGPDSKGVVDLVRSLNAECIRANHEDRLIRYFRHELIRKETGQKNPVYLSEHKQAVYKSLSEDDLVWMASLPYTTNISDKAYAVHAGCEPNKHFIDQDPDQLIRCRYVNDKGRSQPLPKDKSQPKGTKFWAEAWDQPYDIVFGHNVFPGAPVVFKNKNNTCFGIDGGACFGGMLIGMWYERKEFVSVKARKDYWKR